MAVEKLLRNHARFIRDIYAGEGQAVITLSVLISLCIVLRNQRVQDAKFLDYLGIDIRKKVITDFVLVRERFEF